MIEYIVHLDKNLLVFLNRLGSTSFDGFWLQITKQFNWTPYFLMLLLILQKKIGWKKLGLVLLFIAALITFTDQFTNFVKFYFERLRPCNDLEISSLIRIVKCSDTYSFFSGHASNSMASTVFLFLVLRTYYKYAFVVFLFPLLFAYSRIYLGLHFPSDIIVGYFVGATFGFLFYTLYQQLQKNFLK